MEKEEPTMLGIALGFLWSRPSLFIIGMLAGGNLALNNVVGIDMPTEMKDCTVSRHMLHFLKIYPDPPLYIHNFKEMQLLIILKCSLSL